MAHLVQALDEVAMDSYMNVEVWMLVVQVERELLGIVMHHCISCATRSVQRGGWRGSAAPRLDRVSDGSSVR